MSKELLGIHHITAMAGDAQRNLDFYTGVLGLRLVKKTVNFDDPGIYHFYFGDEVGHPGTIITFFPWPRSARGGQGNGQAIAASFAVPSDSLKYWAERLKQYGVAQQETSTRFDEEVLTFRDPDGLPLELVAHRSAAEQWAWRDGPVPDEHAIRGLYGATLSVADEVLTLELLERMGFQRLGEADNRYRFTIGAGVEAAMIDLIAQPSLPVGRVRAGTIHHIAWRVADDEAQQAWREKLLSLGLSVTPVQERNYFRSIYFREPGGVLFEIATNGPGFTVDEPMDELGEHLMLPPWLEPRRDEIQQWLPQVYVREL